MSAPIEEIKGKKNRREKAMELWAAQIFADQARPGAPGQDRSVGAAGGSNFRKEMLQKPGQAREKPQVAKAEAVVAQDRVETTAPTAETQVETQLKAARQMLTSKAPAAPAAETAAPAQAAQQVALEVAEEVAEQTQQVESSLKEAAETTTPEEVSFGGGTVAAGEAKKARKTEKAETTGAASAELEEEEEKERLPLILPGNSPKAKAYVRASELLGDTPHNPDLDDFLVAL